MATMKELLKFAVEVEERFSTEARVRNSMENSLASAIGDTDKMLSDAIAVGHKEAVDFDKRIREIVVHYADQNSVNKVRDEVSRVSAKVDMLMDYLKLDIEEQQSKFVVVRKKSKHDWIEITLGTIFGLMAGTGFIFSILVLFGVIHK
jgi:hypothetical protein